MNYIKHRIFQQEELIYGYQGVKDAFKTGKGKIVMRAKTELEETDGKDLELLLSEIPYQVNKADMIKKTADLINDKKIEGISDIRDESDRSGMSVAYVLKRDAIPNKLF